MPKGDVLKKVVIYLLIILFTAFFFFPVLWMIVTSIKYPRDIFTLGIIPFLQYQPTLQHWYSELVVVGAENFRALFNSTIIGVSSAAIATVLGILAGYSLARYEFKKWKNIDIITWFLSLRFLPAISVAIPFYAMIKSAGLLDTHIAVIILHSAFFLPYAVLVLRDAFKSLPREIEEAAMVDGASTMIIMWRIAVPLIAPAIAAVFILLFSFSWNEFLFAFLLTSKNAVTMPVHIAGSVTTIGVLFYTLSVRQLLAIIPPVILAMLIQKYIVSGLTLGAIKG